MREPEILVEQQPPQGVFVCDHAGLVINKFSLCMQMVRPKLTETKLARFIIRSNALTPNTVELIPTRGVLFPRGGPVQDPVLTFHRL